MRIDPGLFQENERTAPADAAREFVEIGTTHLEVGGELPSVTVAYESWGTLNSDRSNAILVCHALTGDSHAIGWWERLIGPGKALDTDKFYIVATNCLGGCRGTTGPTSVHPDGSEYRCRFPIITVRDMVTVQKRAMESLGIDRLYAVAGGSMGGMQALDWTVAFPDAVDRAFITASCAAHSPMQIGFNEIVRQAILRDSAWKDGDYERPGPVAGLAVGRMVGHLSFLSEAALESKFGRRLQDKRTPDYHFGVEFEVESYLAHQGDKFTARFDANSLLYITRAIDYFELTSLVGSRSKYLFTSFVSDWLYPTHQSLKMHEMALAAGLASSHVEIDLPYGHDAFLLDGVQQARHLREFLAE